MANLFIAWSTPQGQQWSTFLMLLLLITGSQLVVAKTAGRKSAFPHLFFFSAGMLLLAPSYFALLVICSYLVDWAKQQWLDSPQQADGLKPRVIGAHIVAGVAAQGVYSLLIAWLDLFSPPQSVIAVCFSLVMYVVSYWLLSRPVLVTAQSWRVSRRLHLDALLTDCAVMFMGYMLVLLWQHNVWLILPALSCLVLITRAMRVPHLEQAAQTDAKTGLLNASSWREHGQEELRRARYFMHPLSILMVDLDGLRAINNRYGHLAGDAVIIGIARILNDPAGVYAIVGRFGGEEFALVLPEAGTEKAQIVAERLRGRVEAACFPLPSLSAPLRATACFGIATFPDHGDSLDHLIEQADVALFQAKAKGKNCVVSAADEPLFAVAEQDSASLSYQAAFTLTAEGMS